MTTPTWKLAVGAGAATGLALGGFAISPDTEAPVVDPLDVEQATATTDAATALFSPASTTLSLGDDRPVDADVVLASSHDSPNSPDSPVSPDSPDSSDSPVSPNSPDSTDSPDSPDTEQATQAEQNSISRLYLAYFDRQPDPDGHAYWSRHVASGTPLSAVSSHFAESNEFVQTYGHLGDGEFVEMVYANVLSRDPDPGGYQHWTSQLGNGMPRGAMMIGFSESPEFKASSGIR